MILAANDPRAEPAAIFFVLAERRRAFPFAWKLMANLAAQAQARTNGLSLCTDDGELDALCVDVLHRRADWGAVRDWFAARLKTQQP